MEKNVNRWENTATDTEDSNQANNGNPLPIGH